MNEDVTSDLVVDLHAVHLEAQRKYLEKRDGLPDSQPVREAWPLTVWSARYYKVLGLKELVEMCKRDPSFRDHGCSGCREKREEFGIPVYCVCGDEKDGSCSMCRDFREDNSIDSACVCPYIRHRRVFHDEPVLYFPTKNGRGLSMYKSAAESQLASSVLALEKRLYPQGDTDDSMPYFSFPRTPGFSRTGCNTCEEARERFAVGPFTECICHFDFAKDFVLEQAQSQHEADDQYIIPMDVDKHVMRKPDCGAELEKARVLSRIADDLRKEEVKKINDTTYFMRCVFVPEFDVGISLPVDKEKKDRIATWLVRYEGRTVRGPDLHYTACQLIGSFCDAVMRLPYPLRTMSASEYEGMCLREIFRRSCNA